MTLDEAMDRAAAGLDEIIESELQEFEERIRQDIAAIVPEDEEALDRPPDAESPWRRLTVEEAVTEERERLWVWRDETLAALRRELRRMHP